MELDIIIEKISANACLKYGQVRGLAYTIGVLNEALSGVIYDGDPVEDILKQLRDFAEKDE